MHRAYAVAVNRRRHPTAPDRQEPTLGELPVLQSQAHARPGRTRRPALPERRLHRGMLAAVALLVVLVVLFRGFLTDTIMPPSRAQVLVAQAEQAVAAGTLSADDGTGARELYEAAIAIDPDLPEARAGLATVAALALQRAREAALDDRFQDAHAALRLAGALSAPRGDADAVAALLREREVAHAGIDGLVERAEAARAAGRLDGDANAALPLLARVLALQPDHAVALRSREDALGALLEEARDRLRAGDVASAAAAIRVADRYDAGHIDLPDTRARLTEEFDALRQRAETDLTRGRIDAAVRNWRQVLALEPDDPAALAGLRRAAEAQAGRARRLAADFRFADADAALREAFALAPDSDVVRDAGALVARSRLAHRQRGAAIPDAERQRRVADLLEQASAAEAQGHLLTPPGESAYDRIRAAQALAPGDAAVREAVSRLLPMARRCFDAGLGGNDLGRARNCLDMRASLGEDEAVVAQARARLAQRWVAIGEERLRAGQVEGARVALRHARQLAPSVPGSAQLDARLQTAAPTPAD